jgi:hypothetical protein
MSRLSRCWPSRSRCAAVDHRDAHHPSTSLASDPASIFAQPRERIMPTRRGPTPRNPACVSVRRVPSRSGESSKRTVVSMPPPCHHHIVTRGASSSSTSQRATWGVPPRGVDGSGTRDSSPTLGEPPWGERRVVGRPELRRVPHHPAPARRERGQHLHALVRPVPGRGLGHDRCDPGGVPVGHHQRAVAGPPRHDERGRVVEGRGDPEQREPRDLAELGVFGVDGHHERRQRHPRGERRVAGLGDGGADVPEARHRPVSRRDLGARDLDRRDDHGGRPSASDP